MAPLALPLEPVLPYGDAISLFIVTAFCFVLVKCLVKNENGLLKMAKKVSFLLENMENLL